MISTLTAILASEKAPNTLRQVHFVEFYQAVHKARGLYPHGRENPDVFYMALV